MSDLVRSLKLTLPNLLRIGISRRRKDFNVLVSLLIQFVCVDVIELCNVNLYGVSSLGNNLPI